jgi:hypothetical protein
MNIKAYQIFFPIKAICRLKKLSEREISLFADVSRHCFRQVASGVTSITVKSACRVANYLGREVFLMAVPGDSVQSEYCSLACYYKVERDGFDSWKIHFMDFIDQFRKSMDPRLILLPPPPSFNKELTALLASIVCQLCQEIEMEAPAWAGKLYFLNKPWFVAGTESLKAAALVESPLSFRRNNIFVLDNFTARV